MKEIDMLAMARTNGFRLGNAQDRQGGTGCTVLVFPDSAPCAVDVRGGGPASRESELLSPMAAASGIHAILLSGGSAFGLNASAGVMQYLEEQHIGFDTRICKVPLVVESCIYDLAAATMSALTPPWAMRPARRRKVGTSAKAVTVPVRGRRSASSAARTI